MFWIKRDFEAIEAMEAVEAVEAGEVNGVAEVRKSLTLSVWSRVLFFEVNETFEAISFLSYFFFVRAGNLIWFLEYNF